jgi:hypothetical protein
MTTATTRANAIAAYADPDKARADRQKGMGPTPWLRTERARLMSAIGLHVRQADAARRYGKPQDARIHTRTANRLRAELATFDAQVRAITAQKGAGSEASAEGSGQRAAHRTGAAHGSLHGMAAEVPGTDRSAGTTLDAGL